jgi:membrane protease YdiL (CAAX protease family)
VDRQDNIKPLGILPTIVCWAIPAVILYVSHYILVPIFIERTGQPYLVGYLIVWVSTMGLFLIAALAAYRLEGNPLHLSTFAERYRLKRMNRQDWICTLGIFGFVIISYFGLAFTSGWLAEWSPFAPHPVFPPEFGPEGAAGRTPGTLMGMTIMGLGWVAVVYLFGWLFNIFGEELWFRGYILPRQEKAFGNRAWIANGLMFTLNHIWQPWNLLLILPGALIGAFVVQRRKNTWILIISHGLANVILLFIIILNVFGLVL